MTIVSCLCAFLGYVVMIARVLSEEKAQLRGFVVGVERMTITIIILAGQSHRSPPSPPHL
jgi:hypothetical protein